MLLETSSRVTIGVESTLLKLEKLDANSTGWHKVNSECFGRVV